MDEIFDFIALHDAFEKAEHVFHKLHELIDGLNVLPSRGVHPPELAEQGITDYRETFFKPYRIFYRIERKTVFVVMVADGRRNMQKLLQRRLLQS
ncbi:MAG: type II toxin-antitoxin system RelE/ParE family toxin [Candidatus Hydrogenedentes bacterium]|nr:type II toxin-antitoxin system RelE/ParE family toxin [Candidatus Hydrogenedentota bacterium]